MTTPAHTTLPVLLGVVLASCSTSPEIDTAPYGYDPSFDYLAVLKSSPEYAFEPTAGYPRLSYQEPSDDSLTVLRLAYGLDSIAGDGEELSKILNLLAWASHTLTHDGSGSNPDPETSLNILRHIEETGSGVNCVMKAIVLNDAYLAIGLKSRVVHGNGRDWVFNGEWHAFNSYRDGNSEIYVINADGSGLERLTFNDADDTCPAWSPDGTRIAFTSDRDGNGEIYVMHADGGGQRRLTETPGSEFHPDWSPDGGQIAFRAERNGNVDIYVMSADGGDERRLTSDPAADHRPHWSPDGRRILFGTNRDGNFEVYVMDADGGNKERLTESSAWEIFPRFSPDGAFIAFASGYVTEREADVHIMRSDGSEERAVTSNRGREESLAWSPGGEYVAFQAEFDGNWDIYIMSTDGVVVRRLTEHSATDNWPTWTPENPAIERTYGREIRITSRVLHEERVVNVKLPAEYYETNQRYPVLYLLDSEMQMSDLVPVLVELSADGVIPDVIWVGIRNTDRIRDMSPTPIERYPSSSGAAEFLRFVTEELVPYVDRRYRTSSSRLLYGHSGAGRFTVYALLSAPVVFTAGIATSPNLAWDNEVVHDIARRLLRQQSFDDNYLYLGMGTEYPVEYVESLQRFSELLDMSAPEGLVWRHDTFEGEDHSSMAVAGFREGLQQLFSRRPVSPESEP